MSKANTKIDIEAVVAAVAVSREMAAALEQVAVSIGDRATQIANAEARDTGRYAQSFVYGGLSANELRTWLQSKAGKGARRRRRQTGAYSPAIEGEYKGAIGYVGNTDYKAHWIEYGTIKTPPRAVLQRAALEYGADVSEQ
jgi:hypothetical protein